jgi:hypothetical protein
MAIDTALSASGRLSVIKAAAPRRVTDKCPSTEFAGAAFDSLPGLSFKA